MGNGLKIIVVVTILLLSSQLSYAALDATVDWDVRTTGNDSNGGCYDSVSDGGTDYSQQDAAQLSISDLAMTTGGVTLTSATGGFTSAMIDNCIQIASGTHFVAGFYQITGYTDTNTITIDRDATDGSNATNGVAAIGGGLRTLTKAESAMGNGNRLFAQDGIYTETLTISGLSGSGQRQVMFIGYNDAHGDNPTGNNRPEIDCESSRSVGMQIDNDDIIVRNFIVKNCTTYGISAGTASGNDILLYNVRSTNNSSNGIESDAHMIVVGSEMDSNGGSGYRNDTYGSEEISYCYSHDNTAAGFDGDGGGYTAYMSISDTNATGFSCGTTAASCRFYNCHSYNNTKGFRPGQSDSGDAVGEIIANCSCSGGQDCYYLLSSSYIQPQLLYSSCYGMSSDCIENIFTDTEGMVTANPLFTNEASGDFTISSSSPLIGAAIQPPVPTTLKFNIGVDQSQTTAGGGGLLGGGAIRRGIQ